MSQRTSTQRRSWKERALSLLLAAALMTGLIPGLTLPASAEHWADAYLDQLVDWGVMRADQTANPDAALTRAEFFAIVNRAYGYTETGYIPFEDVLETDWFYDDISIAYTAGYMAGTSPTTASPNDPLTREQAFCILGRNMMLKDAPGESLAFADSRDVSDWARGTIKAAADNYIISGYPDNTLHPQDSISKGQMAVLISQCLGTPVRESGEYDLGGVFGNVTITAPNVTLRNTTISGDLYISGGVGLGGIKLENVDVLGRIIVSSTGESEGGSASVIMRNVTADEMLVDNMRNKTVTIRADGITNIANTIVRTNAYIEDNNTDEEGLLHIELDGDPGARLTLAGRIKEVVNKTPSSYIQAAKGTVAKLTVDEAATNSTVQIDRNTKINEVNLDVATSVIGDGDIGQLNINAPGSVVTMLPDKIYIRPGLTASIAGVIMDYQAAEEGSLDPRLLSGYPAAKDIAPTGFRADFAGNKKGTIYWAVSYVSDGSIGEDDLISPPSYGSKAIANGSVAEPTGGEEVSAQVGNLVVGGSYYLSAILVDEQKERSPVKVISFSTPDNTVPAFGQGYPYMSRTTCDVAQVTVMPTKSCKLYYALLPQGAKAPTANELKAAAVTGNLGYGVRDVTKNTEEVFQVNSQRLEELKTYVLYLWLTDVDGANSSAVTSLTFTIPDETPPVVDPVPYSVSQGTTGNTIAMRTGMNERGTIFWAVVPHGQNYPLPNMADPLGQDNVVVNGDAVSARLDSMYAKLGVQGGRGALISGSVAVANPETEVSFNVTGLVPETAYDLYYVGRDAAGNYSAEVKMVTINTLDTSGPIVTLYFINPDGSFTEFDENLQANPPANATIVLDFSENITIAGVTDILTMYKTQKSLLISRLQENFLLSQRDLINTRSWIYATKEGANTDLTGLETEAEKQAVRDRAVANSMFWIDYDKVEVRESMRKAGHVEVVFPYSNGTGAVSLVNGRYYRFELTGIKDTSNNPPQGIDPGLAVSPDNLRGKNTEHVLPEFETAFASVVLSATGIDTLYPPVAAENGSPEAKKEGGTRNGKELARMDARFALIPESTTSLTDATKYEIFIFANQAVAYDLYYRIIDTSNNNSKVLYPDDMDGKYNAHQLPVYGGAEKANVDDQGWAYLGNYSSGLNQNTNLAPTAVIRELVSSGANYPALNTLGENMRYEFSIAVTSKAGDPSYETWNGKLDFYVYIMAGDGQDLRSASSGSAYTPSSIVGIGGNRSVGTPESVTTTANFSDSRMPIFIGGSPTFTTSVTTATLHYWLNPQWSHIYYKIASVDPTVDGALPTIPSTIEVLETVYRPDGTAIEPKTQLNVTNDSDDFYYVIEAQTNRNNPGQLYFTNADGTRRPLDSSSPTEEIEQGELWYYRVVDDAKGSLSEAISSKSGAYTNNTQSDGVYSEQYGDMDLRIPPENTTYKPLLAEEKYYAYIVLTSVSEEGRSKVYIYTFETSPASKPQIDLNSNRDGTVNVSIGNRVETFMEYIMLNTTLLANAPYLHETNWVSADKTLPTQYSGYTALEAMVEKNNATGYSVFDDYADETFKTRVASYIRGAGDNALPGSVTIAAGGNENEPKDTSRMSPGEPYYFIAVGYNTADEEGVGDTFRAIPDISIPAVAIPYITSISSSNIRQVSNSGQYQGTVTITFNDPVYWVPDKGSTAALPVIDAMTNTSATTYVSFVDAIGGSAAGKVYSTKQASSTPSANRSFTLEFENSGTWLSLGATIMIFDPGRIANINGYSSENSILLTLRFNAEKSEKLPDGTYLNPVYEFYTENNGNGQSLAG